MSDDLAKLYPTMFPSGQASTKPTPAVGPTSQVNSDDAAARALYPSSYGKMKGEAAAKAPPTPDERLAAALYPTTEKPVKEAQPATTTTAKPVQQKAPESPPSPSVPLKAPEGFSTADMEAFTKAVPGATQAQLDAVAQAQVKSRMTELDAETASWEASTRADPELAPNFENNIAEARDLLKEYGTPALNQWLAATGFGSHPEIVRFVVRTAKGLKQARGRR